jgi:hypothetical protein
LFALNGEHLVGVVGVVGVVSRAVPLSSSDESVVVVLIGDASLYCSSKLELFELSELEREFDFLIDPRVLLILFAY